MRGLDCESEIEENSALDCVLEKITSPWTCRVTGCILRLSLGILFVWKGESKLLQYFVHLMRTRAGADEGRRERRGG